MTGAAGDALSTMWRENGLDASQLHTRIDGSIVFTDALATGETLAAEHVPPSELLELSTEQLTLGALLGRGGMGEVRVAQQASLRREVAVKTVLDGHGSGAHAALLKEAWVGAALEHPNVVPIHTLARAEGRLAVVMKRIEGTSWAQVLRGEGSERFRGEGRLEAHLRVLLQVCRAITFAHRHGVLHLDLKPDNVMIGEFGEVYVVDWGLACGTTDGPAWLARARDMRTPAGTPAYMAPELVAAQSERIGPRTDVYLLGAILHEIVSGAPPHRGETLMATLARAYLSAPAEHGIEVPKELTSVIHRAMDPEPSRRFESADALREALESFLRHRGAEHFALRADEVLEEVDAGLEAMAPIGAELEASLAECEVAIEQVRREWAEHPRLAALEDALLERRARHAIAEGRLDAAEAFAARLLAPSTALAQRITALRDAIDARDRHVRSLETLGRELDVTLGSRERRRVLMTFAALWASVGVALGWLERSGFVTFGYRELLLEGGLLLATLGPFAWSRRHTLFQNRANRRLYGGLCFTALAIELLWIACSLVDVEVHGAIAVTPLLYAYAFATLALVFDRRFFRGAAVLLISAAIAAVWPAWALDVVGLGGAAAGVLTLRGWK